MPNRLQKITLKGFKTFRDLSDFEPGSLTVLIGPNGAGKSNFISFFRLLGWVLQSPGNLQAQVGELGGASALLFDGPEKTREIEAELVLVTDQGDNKYRFRLGYAAGDTFIYLDERRCFSRRGFSEESGSGPPWREFGAGHKEAKLVAASDEGDTTARVIFNLLRKIIVYQFHNTSSTARMRNKWDVEDNRWLKEDAANIAPFLRRLKEHEPRSYARIVHTIRLVLPFFADFELEADNKWLLLSWRERNSDRVFNAAQAADGMLRVIALISVLLQPERSLPDVLILDEPELGLHPYAINIVGGLIKSLSTSTQIIVATQSMPLIDCFEPDDIVVVDRKGRETELRRLDNKSLDEWLENYSLSELWEKNVIGGRPS